MTKHLTAGLASIAAGLAATAVVGLATPAVARESRISYNCTAFGPHDMSLAVRYRARGSHLQFTAEMEALPSSGIQPGNIMRVFINDRLVGTDLFANAVGHVVADLNLDTEPNDPGEKPWPANLTVHRNDAVRITVNTSPAIRLGCTLR